MKARAPGKIVVSGAYAVLDGHPAIGVAVDRGASADAARPATLVTAEVAAAIARGDLAAAPAFDARELRTADDSGGSRKLGLGSSAAILVASLAAAGVVGAMDDPELDAADAPLDAGPRAELFRRAYAAHRDAQAGGSGIDVAASVHGGWIRLERAEPVPHVARFVPPPGLVFVVFASGTPASTPALRARVDAWRAAEPDRYAALLAALGSAARRTVEAPDAAGFVRALREQHVLLGALGAAAAAAIVTPDVASVAAEVPAEATFGPAGAGGGDVALYTGLVPPPDALVTRARAAGLEPLPLVLGAGGVRTFGG